MTDLVIGRAPCKTPTRKDWKPNSAFVQMRAERAGQQGARYQIWCSATHMQILNGKSLTRLLPLTPT